MNRCSGFSLIELLVAIVIISILAAIAVPNYLHMRVRAQTAQAQSELRNAATAMESYYVDYQSYPYTTGESIYENRWMKLTTPIEYFTTDLKDPFGDPVLVSFVNPGFPGDSEFQVYDFTTDDPHNLVQHSFFNLMIGLGYSREIKWYTSSQGPDGKIGRLGPWIGIAYDPSNGTASNGDIIRSGP